MEASELTGQVIGCAMRIHTELGNGFQEVIYQRCLAIELEQNGLFFKRELKMPIFYQNQHIGTRRVDFLVDKYLSVELKAVIKLENVHLNQAKNYLEAYNLRIGLLINFGSQKLEFKRIYNSKKRTGIS